MKDDALFVYADGTIRRMDGIGWCPTVIVPEWEYERTVPVRSSFQALFTERPHCWELTFSLSRVFGTKTRLRRIYHQVHEEQIR
jgi:hypothetical protein